MVYKIITKTLTIRLTKVDEKITRANKRPFMPGHHMLDGVLILHEFLCELRVRKQQGIILKLDFGKAYDNVSCKLAIFLKCISKEKLFSKMDRLHGKGCWSLEGARISINRVFSLRNHPILDEVVHHESIPQIWWSDFISHLLMLTLIISLWFWGTKWWWIIDQPIPFHKPNKKVSEKMMDYSVPQTYQTPYNHAWYTDC